MTYLLSIDPGVSSGVVLGQYTKTEPYTPIKSWQLSGGLTGATKFLDTHYSGLTWGWVVKGRPYYPVTVICEKFVPLNNKGFGHTLKSVEPLRIEGALIALGIMPEYLPEHYDVWPRPASMYFMGGANKREKLQRSRAWLKEHGLLLTGKDVGQADADDAISATLHAFAYLLHQRHRPTMKHYKIGVNI